MTCKDARKHRARLVHDDELALLVQLACRVEQRTDTEQEVLERVAGLVKLRKLAQDTRDQA